MKLNPLPVPRRFLGAFVRIFRIGLLILAAFMVAAPLVAQNAAQNAAQDIDAPVAQWQTPAVTQSASVNWPRIAEDAQDAAAQQPPVTADQPKSAPPQQAVVPQTAQEKTQREKAEAQIKEQEQQRVLGVLPSFNVSYRSDAVSLTGWQKIRLAFRTSVDPVTFGVAFVVAGYHEADNDVGFGWGIKGYGQRAGAAYLDTFDSNMIGNGILPAILHQDPRYFRLGHGTTTHRILYAAAAAFICKHDNTGKWEPNYSNVGGNIITGAISNLYYPGSNSGIGLTISNGMIVTAEGAFGAMFQEFWPDISRKLFHKDPTNGRDAEMRAAGSSAAGTAKPDKP
jgi:hypothetical protein